MESCRGVKWGVDILASVCFYTTGNGCVPSGLGWPDELNQGHETEMACVCVVVVLSMCGRCLSWGTSTCASRVVDRVRNDLGGC